MSTSILPPPHQHYPHHPEYRPLSSNSLGAHRLANGTPRNLVNAYQPPPPPPPNNAPTSDLRRTATTRSKHSPERPSPERVSHRPSSDMPNPYKRPRQTDWAEFYKNGVPAEVIVIDDDDDGKKQDPPQAVSQKSRRVQANGSSRHTDKKRKTASSAAYDPIYNAQSYSTTQTPYSAGHSSSDRTGSAYQTTAATSLTSQTSNGTYPPLADEGTVGQKRKRTRKSDADERRKKQEVLDDPILAYVPPPRPPIKAKDVKVAVVHSRVNPRDLKCDDDDGHYIVSAESDLTSRYQIIRLLGQGTFGKVVEAYDKRNRTKCAIKIIRSVQKYRDASRIELRVLSTLASNDKENRNKCIHLRDCFDFLNHICIVTDLLGQSVFDFLKGNQFVPFPSSHIQKFARQLFTSVAFLHDLNLIHTDLKPENILLVDSTYQTFTYNRTIPSSSTTQSRQARHRKVLLNPEIRLIDFGSATFEDEYHSSVVSTRHYRAPEIILNLGWSFPCDIWSIGCILVEFFTGDALFQTHDNLEHLAMMEAVCDGKIDRDIVRAVQQASRGNNRNSAASYFKRGQALDYPNADTPKASRKYVKAMKRLPETILPNTEFNRLFLDLLRKIFVYDPQQRITAKQALRHPWFREQLQDDGTEAARIGKRKMEQGR